MTNEVATVTSKGQVTIPKAVRLALGLEENDQILFIVEGDHAVLLPIRSRALGELYGALPATRPYPGTESTRTETGHALGERQLRESDDA
jgi:antitoxin PrlF